MLKTPLAGYFGSKWSIVEHLLRYIPIHDTYVEVFGGSGALLFAKPPSNLEVFNDINSNIVNFFRVIRDPNKFEEFCRMATLVPHSKEEFYNFRDSLSEGTDVERAVKLYYLVKTSFGGKLTSWGFSVSSDNECAKKYLSGLVELRGLVWRLRYVQFENRDYKEIFEIYDSPKTFFYCDPPYVKETRSGGSKIYEFEMDDDEQRVFVERVIKLRGMVMISGYDHPLYKPLEEVGFKKVEIYRFNRLSNGTRPESRFYNSEYLWLNKNLIDHLPQQMALIELF